MTPEEIDSLLHRLPLQIPSADFEDRFLREYETKVAKARFHAARPDRSIAVTLGKAWAASAAIAFCAIAFWAVIFSPKTGPQGEKTGHPNVTSGIPGRGSSPPAPGAVSTQDQADKPLQGSQEPLAG